MRDQHGNRQTNGRPSMFVPAMALAFLILAVAVVAGLIAHVSSETALTARERQVAARKAAYEAGYAAAKAEVVAPLGDYEADVQAAYRNGIAVGRHRGPLDLRGFTADQIKRLHCYLEEKPSDRRVELPPRDQQGRVVQDEKP